MRKITQQMKQAFDSGGSLFSGNTRVENGKVYLFGNLIVERRVDGVYVTNAGWFSATTKDRLNAFVSVTQKDGEWFLNGEHWNGEWRKI